MTTHAYPGSLSRGRPPGTGDPAAGDPGPGESGPGGAGRPDGASITPPAVVALWAALLAVLVAVSAAMGNSPVVLEISGGAAVLVLVIAGAVWLDQRLRPARGAYRLPVRLGGVFLFAVTALTAWLALAFGQFMLYLAVIPLTGAVGLEVAARRYARAAPALASAPRTGPGAERG